MKNLKITKGEWKYKIWNSRIMFKKPNMDLWFKDDGNDFTHEPKEVLANAQLIADAGTTANKCGKLPSELLAERDELLESLKKVDAFIKKNENVNYWCRLLQREVDTETIINKTLSK